MCSIALFEAKHNEPFSFITHINLTPINHNLAIPYSLGSYRGSDEDDWREFEMGDLWCACTKAKAREQTPKWCQEEMYWKIVVLKEKKKKEKERKEKNVNGCNKVNVNSKASLYSKGVWQRENGEFWRIEQQQVASSHL